MKKVTLFLLILGVTMLFAAPVWYDNPQAAGYPQNAYFVAGGVGTTQEEARMDAFSNIAGQMETTVKDQISVLMTSIQVNDAEFFSEVMSRASEVTVEGNLKGAEIVRREQEGNNHYILIVLEKDKVITAMEAELKPLWETITTLYDNAQNSVKDGNLIAAIEDYVSAEQMITVFYSKKSLYDNLSGKPYPLDKTITFPILDSEIRSLVAGIKLEVVDGDNQTAKSGSMLLNPIVFEVTTKLKGERVPLANIPVAIIQDKDVIQRGYTDSDGKYYAYLTATGNDERGKFTGRINLNQIPKAYSKQAKGFEETATYTVVQQTPIAFTLSVTDTKGNPMPKVFDKVAKGVTKIGYMLSDNSPLKLEGIVDVIDTKEIEGAGAMQTMVTTEVSLSLSTKFNNKVVGNYTTEAKGLSKKDARDATNKSYDKVTISKREFNEMIADANVDEVLASNSRDRLAEAKKLYTTGNPRDALAVLASVTHGDAEIKEAQQMITKIRKELNAADAARRQAAFDEREKKRQLELEKAKLQYEKDTMQMVLDSERDKEALEVEKIKAKHQKKNINFIFDF
ncbi:MAG: LPP20 family lipoprotein [Candidatus Cloacimonetes bacterium]|nr:LPP20 family lipoprotein [Candidatus Cloacimonadota bacterium]